MYKYMNLYININRPTVEMMMAMISIPCHIQEISRPDSSLGFQVKVLKLFLFARTRRLMTCLTIDRMAASAKKG